MFNYAPLESLIEDLILDTPAATHARCFSPEMSLFIACPIHRLSDCKSIEDVAYYSFDSLLDKLIEDVSDCDLPTGASLEIPPATVLLYSRVIRALFTVLHRNGLLAYIEKTQGSLDDIRAALQTLASNPGLLVAHNAPQWPEGFTSKWDTAFTLLLFKAVADYQNNNLGLSEIVALLATITGLRVEGEGQ